MTSLRKPENFKKRQVTLDTVMGILNRVIGDQRKLYQSRSADDYYFKDIDYLDSDKVLFKDKAVETNEMTYIRNITGSTDQNSFTGSIKSNDLMFSSDYSAEFWGVLALDFEALCQFIVLKNKVKVVIEADPVSIISKLELLNKEKSVVNEGLPNEAMNALMQTFQGIDYLNKKGEIMPISLYC